MRNADRLRALFAHLDDQASVGPDCEHAALTEDELRDGVKTGRYIVMSRERAESILRELDSRSPHAVAGVGRSPRAP